MDVTLAGQRFQDSNLDGNAYKDPNTGFKAMMTKAAEHVANAYRGTSTTSLAIGTGSKSLTITNANSQVPAFAVGMRVKIAETAAPTVNWMSGTITAWNGETGAATVSVDVTLGSGTIAAWTVSLTGDYNTSAAPDATESTKGILEIATTAETNAGTDDTRAVSPLKLKGYLDNRAASETVQGTIELATQSEVDTGTDAVRAVTPATLVARTATTGRVGLIEIATTTEVSTGTDGTRAVTSDSLHAVLQLFQCRFNYISTTECKLQRYGGKKLFINGVNYDIPSAGVSLSNSGSTDGVVYYIYAYMNAGTMTLERSTTVPADDSTYGHKIKTGDATRTLVGMSMTSAGVFKDGNNDRLTLSFYNRQRKALVRGGNTTGFSTSSTYVIVDSSALLSFLTWGDDDTRPAAFGYCGQSGGSTEFINMNMAVDGVAAPIWQSNAYGPCASGSVVPLAGGSAHTPAIGFHYYNCLAYTYSTTGWSINFSIMCTVMG